MADEDRKGRRASVARSLPISESAYARLKAHCEAQGISMPQFIDALVDDLGGPAVAAGVTTHDLWVATTRERDRLAIQLSDVEAEVTSLSSELDRAHLAFASLTVERDKLAEDLADARHQLAKLLTHDDLDDVLTAAADVIRDVVPGTSGHVVVAQALVDALARAVEQALDARAQISPVPASSAELPEAVRPPPSRSNAP